MPSWDEVQFDTARRRRPEQEFYLFSVSATDLRRLSEVYRRTAAHGPRVQDTSVQRRLDEDRAKEISEFVQKGFPWSGLSRSQRESKEYQDLTMPGWLPTAIIANILAPGDVREGASLSEADAITLSVDGATATLVLPEGYEAPDWRPTVAPIEIIDGQHRLWAFDLADGPRDYQLPLVAFRNLDVTWQAYLFYTINIKPKRINASLAFDLYPLLRAQDWLERSNEGVLIYRETRAQELTEVLWGHDESPWKDRISMLGERKAGTVTQAAVIRALVASFVKRWEAPGIRIGGLFGSELAQDQSIVLGWDRTLQAAFLLLIWRSVSQAVAECEEQWAQALRAEGQDESQDLAFSGAHSLLATDQGMRGIFLVFNDLCYAMSAELELTAVQLVTEPMPQVDNELVSKALRMFEDQPVGAFIEDVARALAKFDWRSPAADGLSEAARTAKMAFRGSGGYGELRRQLVMLLTKADSEPVRRAALHVAEALRY